MTEKHDLGNLSFDQLVYDWRNLSGSRNELTISELAMKLADSGERGVNFLKKQLSTRSKLKKTYAFLALRDKGFREDEIQSALLKFAMSSDPSLQVLAIATATNCQDFSLPESLIDRCINSSDPWVSAWSSMYSAQKCTQNLNEKLNCLRGFLNSANPRLRELSCDKVGDILGELDQGCDLYQLAISDLESMLADSDPDVVHAAVDELELESGFGPRTSVTN